LTDTPQPESSSYRIGGGGAATTAGIRFQQQLGALIASWILAGDRFDPAFDLGAARPLWIRFETEAPVDDLLMETSEGGFVAIQAKTNAGLSSDPESPFGKTVRQFVRHWYEANRGDGSRRWNRSLNPMIDRLVLAVGPDASREVRLILPEALAISAQAGGGVLNQAQREALAKFRAVVEEAWTRTSSDTMDPNLWVDLTKIVRVYVFDSGQGQALAGSALVKALGATCDTAGAYAVLSDICEGMMRKRGGGDETALRQQLASLGFHLPASRRFADDIEALKKHSQEVSEALTRYENIEVAGGEPLTITRDCQFAIERAAEFGSLLVIGEPGAGKSGVMSRVAKSLASKGADVLELAADGFSVETLEGLQSQLMLQNPLLDVLQAWDGSGPAYLMIDALDATRGGCGEGVFRTLIQHVLSLKGRWTVIASIRSFDLRMGHQYRQLFKGTPPNSDLSDDEFSSVRHLVVPAWQEAEFDQLLEESPQLKACLQGADKRLRDLVSIPFNTRMVSELLSAGHSETLRSIKSQSELLKLYWERRVEDLGFEAQACLRTVVDYMIRERTLRAPISLAAADHPRVLESLCSKGVLVADSRQRWVQFRHHLLFDYAAARLYLDYDAIKAGTSGFPKGDALGLVIAPAVGFILHEIWEDDASRTAFWSAVWTLVSDTEADPIIRIMASRLGAELPTDPEDCGALGRIVAESGASAAKGLSQIIGAFAIRIEDVGAVPVEPWVRLERHLIEYPADVWRSVARLLDHLLKVVQEDRLRLALGEAARKLLEFGFEQADDAAVRWSLEFVIDTFETNTLASRELLTRLFEEDRLARLGHDEVPAVCYKIEKIGDADPEFAAEIYRVVFGYEVVDDHKTSIGTSRILPLISSARQDYQMAHWSLGEYFPKFLERHPSEAAFALINAVEGHVSRKYQDQSNLADATAVINGRQIRAREDLSRIWASDPDNESHDGAEKLISKFRKHLQTASDPNAMALFNCLVGAASWAVIWSRIFLCASERKGDLLSAVWPFAANGIFLLLSDTRKDALDAVLAGLSFRTESERQTLEQSALALNFDQYVNASEVRRDFLLLLFSRIGRENLVTDDARKVLDESREEPVPENDRPYRFKVRSHEIGEFDHIPDLDPDVEENVSLMAATNAVKVRLRKSGEISSHPELGLEGWLLQLDTLKSSLANPGVNSSLKRSGEGVLGQACAELVSRRLLGSSSEPASPANDDAFVSLLGLVARSGNPEVHPDTEANFESSQSWGSPAARVEAADAIWDLFFQRPDLYPRLIDTAEALTSDLHPAVRMNALLRVRSIWSLDRDKFWSIMGNRLAADTNIAVITHVLGHWGASMVHSDRDRSLALLSYLAEREAPGSEREQRLLVVIVPLLMILWVRYARDDVRELLNRWLGKPWEHVEVVKAVLFSLRPALISGISGGGTDEHEIRLRTKQIFETVVGASKDQLVGPEAPANSADVKRNCFQLLDTAGSQLYFALDGLTEEKADKDPDRKLPLRAFEREYSQLIGDIGANADPHTVYYLLQLVEKLVPAVPEASFAMMVDLLRSGKTFGYQFESLGVGLVVRMLGVFLADHKVIFTGRPERRGELVECLEIFLQAGWPEARRLIYRLPELLQ